MTKQGPTSRRKFLVLLGLAVLAGTAAFGLAACGKKADLEPPPGAPDEYGNQYPDPNDPALN
jgi:predicted small lipoprotein YifL